jgi:autotransporter-associated beta strand protein
MNNPQTPSVLFVDPPRRRLLERRLNWFGRGVALLAALSVPLSQVAWAANTEYDVINGKTDLTATATYNTGGPPTTGGSTPASAAPTSTSDVTFDSSISYSPSTFFDSSNTALALGSINDLTATPITIENNVAADTSAQIQLSGADSVVGTTGGSTSDQLQVASGASLTFGGGLGPLGIYSEASGNSTWLVNGSLTTTANTTINIVNSKGLTFSGTGTVIINGNVTSTGTPTGYTFAMTGPGSVTLNGTGSAPVGATLTSGTLDLGNQNAMQTNVIAYNGGTLTFDQSVTGNAFNIGGLSGATALALQNNASSPVAIALSVGNNIPTAATYTGNLSGGGSLTKIGSNSQSFSGTDTYSGLTTDSAGTLEFTKEVSLYDNVTSNWTASNIIVGPGATLAFEVGNTGGFTASDILTLDGLGTGSGGFENGSFLGIDTTGGTLTLTNTQVIANTNSGANAVGLNKLGTNSLVFETAQTYTGPTIISAGTLQLGNNTAGENASLASSSIANAGTLLFEPSAATTETYSNPISGAGALTINGAATGIVDLGGVDTYTGATTITSGTLDLQNSLALQNSAVSPASSSDLTFDSSVTSKAFTVGGLGSNQNITLQNTAGAGITLTIGGNQTAGPTFTYTGNFLAPTTGVGALTLYGFSNTITLEGADTYTGATTILGGTLNLGGGTANGSINSGSALVLGGIGGGATLSYTRTGTVAQSFNGTSINSAENFITTSTANQTLNLGALTESVGGTVDINPNTTSSITTTTGNTNGILGGWATYGGKTTWAVGNGGSSTITGLATGSYYASIAGTTAPGATANVDFTASNTTNWSTQTINSLRFNQAAADTLTIATNNVLSIASGGILVTPTAAAVQTITGGAIVGSQGGQLAINIGATSGAPNFTVGSLIEDNGSATALTLSGFDTGYNTTIKLNNGSNSYSGGTYFNGNSAIAYANGTPFGTGNVIFGDRFSSSVGYGTIGLSGASVITSGFMESAFGTNSDNGQIGSNTGGTWTIMGVGTGTFNGTIGTAATGRESYITVDSGTQIYGALSLAGSFNGVGIFTVNGGTLQLGDGYSGTVANETTSVVLGGGTFSEVGNVAGTYNQTFTGGLTVNSGASTVTVNANGGAGTLFTPGAITRSVGGTLNFNLPSGTQSAINGITTTSLNTNGILGGYATVGGNDWATNSTNTSGGNIVGLSTVGGYTLASAAATSSFTNANIDVDSSQSPGSTINPSSLRFNTSGGYTLTLATGANVISSGGILVTNAAGSGGANYDDITGGTLEGSASGDLVIIQNNTLGGMEIDSLIANNTAATALTLSGPGLLKLNPGSANTFTGAIYLNGGTLNTTSNGIGSAASFTFNGGDLQAAGAITSSKAVTIGINGGTIDTNGNTVTLSGNVTKDSGNEFAGAGALGGFVATGVGSLTKNGAGTLSLQGTGDTFGGGLIINNGTVQDGASSGTGTLGTGYVTFGTSNTPTLDLDGHSVTVAGLIGAGSNGAITSSVSGTPTLTLDGVYGETFGGAIGNGSGTVAITENLNNATETVTFLGTNTYTGSTLISSGNMQIGNGTAGSVNSSNFTLAANQTLGFNEPTTSTVNGTIANSGTVIGNESANVTNTLAGAITGSGGFSQTGSGTTNLSTSNGYTGKTTVSGGTLIVSGSITGTGAVSLGAAILEADGTVNNAATVTQTAGTLQGNGGSVGAISSSGGNVAPGLTVADASTATGSLTAVGNVTFATATNFDIRLGVTAASNGTDSDNLNVTGGGAVALNGANLVLTIGQYLTASDVGDTYNIITGGVPADGGSAATEFTYNSSLVGNGTTITDGSYMFTVNYDAGGDGYAQLTLTAAVPEPGTWAMMIAGGVMLIGIQRRRRRY